MNHEEECGIRYHINCDVIEYLIKSLKIWESKGLITTQSVQQERINLVAVICLSFLRVILHLSSYINARS